MNAEKLISFIPTVGFNYFSNTGAVVQLNETQSLEVAAYDTTVGFIGASLAQSKINPNGTSALTYYVTGTYYQDMGGERDAVFTSGGDTVDVGIDSIGSYGDISLGLSYLQSLSNGPAGARQLNAGAWVDTRFGENVSDSYSLTAQIRLSF